MLVVSGMVVLWRVVRVPPGRMPGLGLLREEGVHPGVLPGRGVLPGLGVRLVEAVVVGVAVVAAAGVVLELLV